MVLDPITALGLVANICQFVDYGLGILSKANQIYKSIDGTLEQEIEVENINSDLKEIFKKLSASTSGSSQIDKLARGCCNLIDELLLALVDLQIPGKPSKWKSFRKAIKTVRSKDKIETWLARIDNYRQEFQIHIAVELLLKVDLESAERSADFKKLEVTQKDLILQLSHQLRTNEYDFEQYLAAQSKDIKDTIKDGMLQEHLTTRQAAALAHEITRDMNENEHNNTRNYITTAQSHSENIIIQAVSSRASATDTAIADSENHVIDTVEIADFQQQLMLLDLNKLTEQQIDLIKQQRVMLESSSLDFAQLKRHIDSRNWLNSSLKDENELIVHNLRNNSQATEIGPSSRERDLEPSTMNTLSTFTTVNSENLERSQRNYNSTSLEFNPKASPEMHSSHSDLSTSGKSRQLSMRFSPTDWKVPTAEQFIPPGCICATLTSREKHSVAHRFNSVCDRRRSDPSFNDVDTQVAQLYYACALFCAGRLDAAQSLLRHLIIQGRKGDEQTGTLSNVTEISEAVLARILCSEGKSEDVDSIVRESAFFRNVDSIVIFKPDLRLLYDWVDKSEKSPISFPDEGDIPFHRVWVHCSFAYYNMAVGNYVEAQIVLGDLSKVCMREIFNHTPADGGAVSNVWGALRQMINLCTTLTKFASEKKTQIEKERNMQGIRELMVLITKLPIPNHGPNRHVEPNATDEEREFRRILAWPLIFRSPKDGESLSSLYHWDRVN